ncbi:MAG: YfhO family protein [Candidatus Electryoneaceae bacterium]|nr:YfhO family protein [Candidatus Electryoneaceae bacterium]
MLHILDSRLRGNDEILINQRTRPRVTESWQTSRIIRFAASASTELNSYCFLYNLRLKIMAKGKKRKIQSQPSTEKKIIQRKKSNWERWLMRHKGTILVVVGFYLLIAIFFSPIVLKGIGLTQAADMIASMGMYVMGEEAIASGHFPLWNPTLFCGLPMFASLQYALFTYPPEYLIRLFSYIFGVSDYRIWLFHYFLAGLFTYLLARHYGCRRLTAWLAGAAYGFSPQLIVLADVAHGSKLMGMVYLPLIWLMMDRLRLRPSIGRVAALGCVFAIEILSLHPQVAAYGALLMGTYLLYYGVTALMDKGLRDWVKFALGWAGAMALSVALSAVLWVSVLDYSHFSIRGSGETGVAGSGVAWDYATGWSFHPLESITYLFPNFMGFSNPTYWGTVGTPSGQPFTQNPMYFGCIVLLLAILAIVLTRKSKWGFPITLGLIGWTVSFGKYLPVVYGMLFYGVPFFNKFRAPVMGQVLLLLPMAVLAGIGLEALIGRIKPLKEKKRLRKGLWWTAGIAAGMAFLVMVIPGLFTEVYRGFAGWLRPGTNLDLLAAAEKMARPDVIRVCFLIALTAGLSALALMRKVSWQLLAVIFIGVLLIDLWPVNQKLINYTEKYQPEAFIQPEELFQPEGIVQRLQIDADKFRIHPLIQGIRPKDPRYNNANWWSCFGLESTSGYFGAKSATYQQFMNASSLEDWRSLYHNPQILDALNVRYIITTVPLDRLFMELQRQGWGPPARDARDFGPALTMTRGGAYLYRNPGELSRVRLIDRYRVISEFDATMTEMVHGDWDPRREVLLDREPSIKPGIDGDGDVRIVSYENETIVIDVQVDSPKLLILADSYYPSGWIATIDGEVTEILRADGVLRAIAIPSGNHSVEFRFKPTLFYVGLWISVIAVLIAVGVGIWTLVVRKSG